MSFCLDRRGFLRRSAILGGSLLSCSIPFDRSTNAAPVADRCASNRPAYGPGNHGQLLTTSS